MHSLPALASQVAEFPAIIVPPSTSTTRQTVDKRLRDNVRYFMASRSININGKKGFLSVCPQEDTAANLNAPQLESHDHDAVTRRYALSA